MKRMLIPIACAALALLGCSTMPPWKSVPSGQQAEYGRIETSRDLMQFLAFSDDPGITVIAVQDKGSRYSSRYAFLLDEEERGALRGVCEKFDKWMSIAEENSTEITKTIATLDLSQMYYENRKWERAEDRQVSFVFTSRIDRGGNQEFFLTIRPSPVFMMRAFFMVYGRDTIVLSVEQENAFHACLEEEAVDKGYQKAKKKQDVIDLFN